MNLHDLWLASSLDSLPASYKRRVVVKAIKLG